MSTIAQPFDFTQQQVHTKQRGLWSQAFLRLRQNRLAVISGAVLGFILLLSVLAEAVPAVRRYDYDENNYSVIDQKPSTDHFLGTDNLGRDMWSRLLQGTLFSLKIGFLAEAVVVALGITFGMLAALGGKKTDQVVVWITDMAYAFPDLLMIILFRQVLFGRAWPIIGTGDPQLPGFSGVLIATVLAISFVSWVTVCRLVRGQILSLKQSDYVMAARSIGASQWRIVRVHMLPNTLSTVIVAVTFGIPTRIFAEAALGFIGLSVPAPFASLGTLVNDGYAKIYTNNLLVIWPCIMIAVLMLCFTFLGDGLRDALDPRTRK
ncbi:MAG: ABC transporter permease [Dehalococcoidia bacterium]|nr:ABC transporter permease [Dehalococcoidia bacterium]